MHGRNSSAVMAVAALAVVASCTGSPAPPNPVAPEKPDVPQRRITVWTAANDPHQVAGTTRIIAEFTAATDIKVDLVPLTVRQMHERAEEITRGPGGTSPNAAPGSAPEQSAGTRVPDVLGSLPLMTAHTLATSGFLDPDAAGAVLDELGRGTFQDGVLDLTVQGDQEVAVPSDAWTQLLVFRKDLFADAGLPVPDTFAKLRRAAKELGGDKTAGIAIGNAPGDTATARTFEYLALASGCRLVDEAGRVALDSAACVDALDFYARLAGHAGSGGAKSGGGKTRADVTVTDVRAAYLAGDAAIVPASSAFLDELAGLDPDERPRCGPCGNDPAFLAKNSSVVTALRGSQDGDAPIQYGGIDTWAVTTRADTEAATRFVAFMMDEGYLQWLGLEAAGSIPLRHGTGDDAERFTQAWSTMPTGPRGSTSLAALYPSTVLDLLRTSPANFTSWGLARNSGELAGSVRRHHTLAKTVSDLLSGGSSPQEAAEDAQRRVEGLRDDPPEVSADPAAPEPRRR